MFGRRRGTPHGETVMGKPASSPPREDSSPAPEEEIRLFDRGRRDLLYLAVLIALILGIAVVVYAFNLEMLSGLFGSDYFNNFTRVSLALLIVAFVAYLMRRERDYSRQSMRVFEELRRTTDGLRKQMEDLTALLEVSKLVAIADDLHARLEKKMPHMKGHWKRVAFYAVEIARRMELDEDYVRLVERAANLMDIGMLQVAGQLSDAAFRAGELAPADKEMIKRHPLLGAEMLAAIRPNWEIIPIVRGHHEWWNGMGYPDGLKGESIPLGARILSVADAFVAMTSWRGYRDIKEVKEAVKEITTYSGVQFDPRVVNAFLAVMTPRIYGMEGEGEAVEELRLLREINVEPSPPRKAPHPL
ncbi:MAG: HD domain-containing phosphohydrolase [Actinomycetota bacterium]|nr:HD domain-containing phosphohydrolase [Actinomycetota bacterium]MDI7251227.1 HD domain-containing phosphohydrolase [Actinomycetota bacterium]